MVTWPRGAISIGEEDFRDLVRPGPRAADVPWLPYRRHRSAIRQDDDRPPRTEKTDDVVAVGAEGAAMRHVTLTGDDIRIPAEAVANGRAVVGPSGSEGMLQ